MSQEGSSFLPRIISTFYAIFDVRSGPKIVYQVPEGLIDTSLSVPASSASPANSSFPPGHPGRSSRASSIASNIPRNARSGSPPTSQSSLRRERGISTSNSTLFHFDDVSQYVIPRSELCGRVVISSTHAHRIIGFPIELAGEKYARNYFKFNICFVFESGADLSCYEPIVRKISRVLVACEEESSFLSSPNTSQTIYAILEQLYEDLTSYSETSIPIDKFNSIELKIFPFYPNPPPVHDWQVPVALINLDRRVDPNWDLTVAEVCKYIDGVNHVGRIAHLANCDIRLARQVTAHFLYYQVVMMIDIFQYSNMYTLQKSIQWLAEETHVSSECGPYVTIEGFDIPDFPQLLHLYSRLKPGVTVSEWMETYEVQKLGVDPRRFTSFGMIKGFLRRVHRWPVLTAQSKDKGALSPTRRRGKSLITPPSISSATLENNARAESKILQTTVNSSPTDERAFNSPRRRASVAEKYLEQLRKDIDPGRGTPITQDLSSHTSRARPLSNAQDNVARRHSSANIISSGITTALATSTDLLGPSDSVHGTNGTTTLTRPRLSRSPSSQSTLPAATYPPDLKDYLDGKHHTDELSVRFEAGWPLLEKYLVAIGGGQGNSDYGRVELIYH